MITYQDREVFKRQIVEKEREYFKKKQDLEKMKDEILWNIEQYENTFGQTSYFDDMKQERLLNKTYIPKYAPGYKPDYPKAYNYNPTKPIQQKDDSEIRPQFVIGLIICIIVVLWIIL